MRDVHSFNQLITAQSKHLLKTQHKPAFMLQAGATAVNLPFKVRLFVNKKFFLVIAQYGIDFIVRRSISELRHKSWGNVLASRS